MDVTLYADKQSGREDDNKKKKKFRHQPLCLLENRLARAGWIRVR
jgi:hypothetical protein